MADVDDAAALFLQHIDDTEQVLYLGLGQRRGGLVKNDDLGVIADRLGDLHHLPLGNGQGGHDRLGVNRHIQSVKNLAGTLGHRALADHDATHLGIATQPQVVLHGASQGLVQLLMDHGHTVFQGFLGTFKVDLLAVQSDGAGIPIIDPEQALHQGGLSSAVLSHQSMDCACPDGEIDVIQGLDAGELLADPLHFQQNWMIHEYSSSLLCVEPLPPPLP